MCCDHDLVITHSVSRVLVAVRLKSVTAEAALSPSDYFTDLEGRKEEDPSSHWDFYSSSLFGKPPRSHIPPRTPLDVGKHSCKK